MTWTLISSIAGGAFGNPTVGPIDTSGSDFIAIVTTNYNGIGGSTITDSKSNSWNRVTFIEQDYADVYLDYTVPTSVGSGHTFTTSSTLPTLCVTAWSGSNVTPSDQSNQFGQSSTGTTIQAGSITPSENGCLIIGGVCSGSGTIDSIDSGFTIEGNVPAVGGSNLAGALAYFIQTSASATNPTWTYSDNVSVGAVIASFKGAGGAAAGILGTNIICL